MKKIIMAGLLMCMIATASAGCMVQVAGIPKWLNVDQLVHVSIDKNNVVKLQYNSFSETYIFSSNIDATRFVNQLLARVETCRKNVGQNASSIG